jgi:DNA-binding NarL/FixJ family response regulator
MSRRVEVLMRTARCSVVTSVSIIGDDGVATRILAGAGIATSDAPDVVVLLAPGDAADRIVAIGARAADVPIVAAMPAGTPRPLLRKALRAGADGIVLDDALEHTLASAVVAVAAGQLVVPRTMRRQIAPHALSHREKQVLALVVNGFTNRQIAHRLYLAESTVKTHLASAFDKLEVRSRAAVAELVLDPDEGAGLGVLELAQTPETEEAALTRR